MNQLPKLNIMKKALLSIALLAFIFMGCNSNKKTESTTNSHQAAETVSHDNHDDDDHHSSDNGLSNNWINEIATNNGAKWEANPETNEGVEKMQNLLKTQDLNTLEDYYKLAEQLNSDKNYIVKNCTMKGASHDNLHTWLVPLIAKIEALSNATSMDEALKLFHSIDENVNKYSDYFE